MYQQLRPMIVLLHLVCILAGNPPDQFLGVSEMSMKVPDVGERNLLTLLIAGIAGAGAKVKLFSNNFTVIDATVLGDFTEATYTGYAAQTLAGGAVAGSNTAGRATASWTQQSYTCTGGSSQTIYGYYIVDSTGAILYFAENFATPVVLSNGGAPLLLTPRLTNKSEL